MKEKTNESFCVEQQLKFTDLRYKLGKKKFRIEKKNFKFKKLYIKINKPRKKNFKNQKNFKHTMLQLKPKEFSNISVTFVTLNFS